MERNLKKERRRSYKPVILTSVGIISILALSLLYGSFRLKGIPKIEEEIKDINNRLTFTVIEEEKALNINDDKSHILKINLRKEFLSDTLTQMFKRYEYTIETGGDFNQIPSSEICVIIDSIRNSKSEKIKSIIERLKIDVKLSGFKFFEIEISGLQVLLAEVFFTLATINDKHEFDIFLKGYADGYSKEWNRKLSSNKLYNYRSIDIIPTLDSNSLNPVNYSGPEISYTIGAEYGNKDLPNLRAKFVKEDLLPKVTRSCADKIRQVKILEGYEFSHDYIDSTKRMVQFYLRLIKK
jgi:hypothetical protein